MVLDIVSPRHPIYLIRHGRTALNAEGRFQGLIDVPLDDQGRIQAKATSAKLASVLDTDTAKEVALQSSPLVRATETMGFVAAALRRDQADIIQVDALKEMSFGRWEGKTTLDVKDEYPAERKLRKLDRWNFSPTGGESYADLADRVETWLQSLEGPVVAVTHMGVLRVVAVVATGCDRESAMQLVPDEAEIWCLSDGTLNRL